MLNVHVIQQVLKGRCMEKSLATDIEKIFVRFSGDPMRHRRASLKKLSTNTEQLRLYNIAQAFEELHRLGYKLRYAKNLTNKHVKCLVQSWVDAELSPKTMDNKISYLRWFVACTGRKGMITELEEYVPEGTLINRSRIAETNKTFTGNDIDPADVIKDAMALDRRVGFVLLIMLTFGVRVAEASKMRIRKRFNEALTTAKLVVDEGAKNGRPRELPIESRRELDVLVDAMALVDGPHGSLIPQGRTWSSWRSYFYRQVHKVGLKRDGENVLGLTPHSFRHQNLNDLFYRVTGKPSPIQGGVNFDPSLYEQAMEEVTQRAGHFDRSKAGAYLSTPRRMTQLAKQSHQQLCA